MKHLLIFMVFVICSIVMDTLVTKSATNFPQLISKVSSEEQEQAVLDLIKRLLPNHFEKFNVSIDSSFFELKENLDAFEFKSIDDGRLLIHGTTGVAASSGFYHYLKYWCGCHISWSGDQLYVPDELPKVLTSVKKIFKEKFRYYQNVCTVSYSMSFWNWSRWEREIDWMAMNGINLPLAFNGQEAIWQIVYHKLGLTDEELLEHFGGPAFLAWQRMGNLEGWGGLKSMTWHQRQLHLQQFILKRMRSLGIIPVLPGFAGHIPKALISRVPDAKYYKLNGWNGFGETYLLDPLDPLFKKIGSLFIETQQTIYNGTNHIYNADVFNEMQPSKLTPDFMKLTSQSVYHAMSTADPNAIWLMQAWMFNAQYWTEDLIKAWFTGVPRGKLILLDVGSELNSIYIKTNGFYGYPFIWSMIENFGGVTRLFGQLGRVSKGIINARKNYPTNMIGIGMTPEGINQNDINFELLNEMGWRDKSINVTEWGIDYITRRYGSINPFVKGAWSILLPTLYNGEPAIHNGGLPSGRPVVMRPKVMKKIHPIMWYQPKDIRNAWKDMVNGASTMKISETFRYDLVKLGTQVLEDVSVMIYQRMMDAYFNKTTNEFIKLSAYMIDLIKDMDSLLSSEKHSLLGEWIESARQMGETDDEKNMFEFNSRNQITLWGPSSNILDYANKNWGGLMQSYYLPRWILFKNVILECMSKRMHFNETNFNQIVFQIGNSWTKDLSKFPTEPVGDPLELSIMLVKKYGDFSHSFMEDRFWNEVIDKTYQNSHVNNFMLGRNGMTAINSQMINSVDRGWFQ